jgi:hypothetical protein
MYKFDVDKFLKSQEELGCDFQRVLNANLDSMYEVATGTCTTAAEPPPSITLEQIEKIAVIVERTPRLMTDKEFYELHGDMSGVILPEEQYDALLVEFPLLKSYSYFKKSEYIDTVYIFSENNKAELGYIIKGKLTDCP